MTKPEKKTMIKQIVWFGHSDKIYLLSTCQLGNIPFDSNLSCHGELVLIMLSGRAQDQHLRLESEAKNELFQMEHLKIWTMTAISAKVSEIPNRVDKETGQPSGIPTTSLVITHSNEVSSEAIQVQKKQTTNRTFLFSDVLQCAVMM